MQVRPIDLERIEQNENSRITYHESDLAELMGSMKKDGLLAPIGVFESGKNKFECVWGNRRLTAARKLGWAQIPAIVIESKTESERDILNLTENLKRVNISVAEEGRMYQIFMDRGMSESEIAAKLGISVPRIQLGLKVFHELPEEFHGKITNAAKGPQKKGQISATAAQQILTIKKNLSLSKEDAKKLLEFASRDRVSPAQLRQIAPLVKSGMGVDDAVAALEEFRSINVSVLLRRAVISRLEKQYKRSIGEILSDMLATHRELKLGKAAKTKPNVAA